MSERKEGDPRSLREQELDEIAPQDSGATATSVKKKKNRAAKSAEPLAATSASSSTAGQMEAAQLPKTEVDSAVTRRKAREAEHERAREILQAHEDASAKRRKLRAQELAGSAGEKEFAATGSTGKTAARRLPISSTEMSGKAPDGRWESPSRNLKPEQLRLAQEGHDDDQSMADAGDTSYVDILSRASEGEERVSELDADDRSRGSEVSMDSTKTRLDNMERLFKDQLAQIASMRRQRQPVTPAPQEVRVSGLAAVSSTAKVSQPSRIRKRQGAMYGIHDVDVEYVGETTSGSNSTQINVQALLNEVPRHSEYMSEDKWAEFNSKFVNGLSLNPGLKWYSFITEIPRMTISDALIETGQMTLQEYVEIPLWYDGFSWDNCWGALRQLRSSKSGREHTTGPTGLLHELRDYRLNFDGTRDYADAYCNRVLHLIQTRFKDSLNKGDEKNVVKLLTDNINDRITLGQEFAQDIRSATLQQMSEREKEGGFPPPPGRIATFVMILKEQCQCIAKVLQRVTQLHMGVEYAAEGKLLPFKGTLIPREHWPQGSAVVSRPPILSVGQGRSENRKRPATEIAKDGGGQSDAPKTNTYTPCKGCGAYHPRHSQLPGGFFSGDYCRKHKVGMRLKC